MQPILREYSGLPLLVRRYANQNVADFALDLFLERPALIVEHQNYFRDSDQVIGFIKRSMRSMNKYTGQILPQYSRLMGRNRKR